MYKIILCLLFTLLAQIEIKAQIVNIPDANFKAALLAHGSTITGGNIGTIDTNSDGEIQVSEAQVYLGAIIVSSKSIMDLTGIDEFTALTELVCNNNQITNIDLSANTALTYLNLSRNQITNIDLSANTALTYVYCSNNPISNLDVSNNTALTSLICEMGQSLTSLDVSNNIALTSLVCDHNQLTQLDVSANTALTNLRCTNNQLTNLDIQTNTALTRLECRRNQLTSLDLRNNPALLSVECEFNQLTSLNTPTSTTLVGLFCDNNQLTNLDVSSHVNLINLQCHSNHLNRLDISNNPDLVQLYCSNNMLSNLNTFANTQLVSLQCYNNQISNLDLSRNTALHSFYGFNNLPFLQICVTDTAAVQSSTVWFKDSTASYVENCQQALAVHGIVVMDSNNNCQVDTLEQGVPRVLLLLHNNVDSIYTITNEFGSYQVYLDTGMYTVTAIPSNTYSIACPNNQQVTIDTNYQLQTVDFTLQATTICPYLEVDISTPLLRRCFNSTYYVDYCNTGTAAANNAYIEVELDTSLYFNSSSIPLVSQTGNTYRFNVGNLAKNTCSRFSINVTVSCSSQFGQIHCAEAHIYPDSLCLTSLPNIHIADTCLTDTVLFVITNYADAVTLPYLLLEDTIVVDTGSFTLNMGQSASLYYPLNSNGTATYQLVLANGNPTHYTATALVGCNANSASTDLLHLPNLPQNFADIDCTPNRGSYDPNDKIGYPLGYTSNHYIQPNSTIDYRIRFQNTGTDTAIFINILDTVSPYLDLSTLNMGVASHAYTLQIMPSTPGGQQVLRFQFNPIYLPDSNANEPASNGFIQYNIAQQANLPNGTIINNSASIYFDYNAPVKTNTTLHTVCDNCYPENISNAGTVVLDLDEAALPNYKVLAIPNPFSTETRIEVQGYNEQGASLKLEVYDVMGRLQTTLNGNQNGQFLLQRGEMPVGIYFFRISERGKLLQSGRLMVGE